MTENLFVDEAGLELNDPPRLVWVKASDAVGLMWRENPKLHDLQGIVASIRRHAFQMPGKFDAKLFRVGQEPDAKKPLGAIKAGNGRYEAVAWLEEHWADVKADEEGVPRGLAVDGDGAWCVPVLVGTDAKSTSAAMEFAIDDNNMVAMGGDLDGFDMARLWDAHYVDLLTGLDELPVSVDAETLALLSMAFDEPDWDHEPEVPDNVNPNPRKLPLDVIYTIQGADCSCCLAVQAGLRYGIQSAAFTLCPYTGKLNGRHDVVFIDNDYFNYDHRRHLEVVQEYRPKYTTVRDIMSIKQCQVEGIEYYPLEQILEWAEELSEYASMVIVIPKYDCLDAIPDKYILGFSIPTSHGGTPLPPEMFKGRPVHLLGGSWKDQLSYLSFFGDDVISLDNNYIRKQANFASFVYPDGSTGSLEEDLGLNSNIPRYVALAISFGAIGMKLNGLFNESKTAV